MSCGAKQSRSAMLDTLLVKSPASRTLNCRPGQYAPESTPSICAQCEKNHFCLGGDHYKIACHSGTSKVGISDRSDCQCKEGSAGIKGVCIPCDAQQCDSMYNTVGCGGTSYGECVQCLTCPAGFFRQDCKGNSTGVCVACPANTFAEGEGLRTSCSPCQFTCDPGQYLKGCEGGSKGACTACEICEAGKYRTSCNRKSPGTCVDCKSCDAGEFTEGCGFENPGKCTACPDGKYMDKRGIHTEGCLKCITSEEAKCTKSQEFIACTQSIGPGKCESCSYGQFFWQQKCENCCPSPLTTRSDCNKLSAWLSEAIMQVKQLIHKEGGVVISQPMLSPDGSTVYVGALDKTLYALDAGTGAVRWTFVSKFDILQIVLHPDGLSMFVATSDQKVHALHARGGALKWSYKVGDDVILTHVLSSDGSSLYLGSRDDRVYALNTATGAQLWSYQTGGDVAARPVVSRDGSSLFFTSLDGKAYAVKTLS
jgi:hypothetical protein